MRPEQIRPGDLRMSESNAGEQELLQQAIQHSARMEALGSLTVGIAHDFNNLLTVLVGNLYLVAEDVRDQPKLFEKLKSARDAGKRGADLIKQLLAFARREQIEADVIDAGKVVEGIAPLLQRALGSRIALQTELDPTAASIRASTAQLESVVVNLAINARDAIQRKGSVKVKVASVQVSSADAARYGLASAGAYVAVSIADDGCGIPAEALSRIFEPFFSTKRERGGTGLGLSMVRWFAEQHGGCVHVESVIGKGTTFTLLLPPVADAAPEPLDKTMPLSVLPTGTETVLVLAAEQGLRSTIRQILEVLGYTVRFSTEPEEMLASLHGGQVQALILDVAGRADALPADLLAAVRGVAADVKVVIMADAATSREGFEGAAVLLKPFSLADLAKAVRDALDA